MLSVPGPEKAEKAPEPLLGATSAPGGKNQETVLAGSVTGAQGNAPAVASTVGAPPEPPVGPPGAAAGPPQIPTALGAGQPTVDASAAITASQRDRQFNCELSTLGDGTASSCSAGWLSAQRLLVASPAALAPTAASVAAAAGSPPGGGHGGSGGASPPVNPAPGPAPAPSGASGSAAGFSGVALSGFLTLAGLLLLGAPRAMRRLRLSCQPWRTACFVLIPERPG